jgi:integrase
MLPSAYGRETAMSVRKREWKTAKGEARVAWTADYFDQAGKRHQMRFKTKKLAEAFLVEAKHEVSRGIHTPASTSPTVAQAASAWIEELERGDEHHAPLERSTLREYRRHLDQHILPFTGKTKIAELTPGTIAALRAEMHKKGCSLNLTGRVVSSLGGLLSAAVVAGTASRNIVHEINMRKKKRGSTRHEKHLEVGTDIPTKDEIRAMLTAAQGQAHALLVTAIFTGLRASELRGLRWADVDLDNKVLEVRQRADRWNQIGSPKSSASRREVPFGQMVVNALRQQRDDLAAQHLPSIGSGYVFPNGNGKVMALGSIHYRILGPLQQAAGVSADSRPKYSMHSFRHVAASLFIEQGLGPKRVQALMGHSTIQMTYDTYGHLFPSKTDDQAAMQEIESRLLG